MRIHRALLLASLTACSLDWSNESDGSPADGDASDSADPDGTAGDGDGSVEVPEDGTGDACNDGFEVSGTDCVDIDECATDNGGCTQRCDNRPGTFVCACEPGHTLAADGVRCIPFAWSTPALLELRDDPARTPSLAVDAEGRAVVAWSLGFGGIWANRYLGEAGWQGAVQVQDPDGVTGQPVVAASASGDVLALWNVGDAGAWSSRLSQTGTWEAPSQLDTAAYGTALAVRGDEAAAVWLRPDGTLGGSRYMKGSGWRTQQTLDAAGAAPRFPPSLTLDAQGVARAVWTGKVEGDTWSAFGNHDDGMGSWAQAAALERVSTDVLEEGAFVAALAEGGALAVWSHVDMVGNFSASAAHDDGTSGYGTPVVLADAEGISGRVTALTSDASGTAFAVGESARGVWAARHVDGRWQDAVQLAEAGREVQVAMDGSGNALVVFRLDANLWASRYRARADAWTPPERIEHIDIGSALASSHRVVLDAAGHGFVTWVQVQDRRNVWVTRLEACGEEDGCAEAWPPACPADGSACACPEGFTPNSDGSACVDIDECALGTDGCDNEPDACVNREGGYECICPQFLPGDGFGDLGCSGVMSPWD